MATITCAHCKATHTAVEAVRRCHADETFTCGWQYQARDRYGVLRDEDGQEIILECDALAWDNGRAIVCENGHEHVNAEARHREGWDYADEEEGPGLMRAGVFPIAMDGTGLACTV
jgi:hypothetical protein